MCGAIQRILMRLLSQCIWWTLLHWWYKLLHFIKLLLDVYLRRILIALFSVASSVCVCLCKNGCWCMSDVGGYFEAGTLVRYDFLANHGGSLLGDQRSFSNVSNLGEGNLTQEQLVFSFSTSSAPSILVYISSRSQDYMAVVLRQNGRHVNTLSFINTICHL